MDDIFSIAQTFLVGAWTMMRSVYIPGTDISIGAFSVAAFIVGFSIRVLGFLTGFRMGSYGAAADAAEKGKNAISRLKRKSGE